MEYLKQDETTALTVCGNCSAELYAFARFCRFCGTPSGESRLESSNRPEAADSRELQTRLLQVTDSYRPVSGPLIGAVGAGFVGSRALQVRGGLAKTLLFALISIPLWLLIVLLSPFDAYLAARAIASNQ
jgi:hypothetical protein